MPRFFFHTEDGRCFPDHSGLELPDLAAAKREALATLGEMLRHDEAFWRTEHFRLLVSQTSSTHDPLYTLEVSGGADGGPH